MRKLYRQGDVLIMRVGIVPARAATVVPMDRGRVILAYGEVTGHAHAVEGDVEFLAADLEEVNDRFLTVQSEARVVHEEHDPITLPAGVYEVRRQREYVPENERGGRSRGAATGETAGTLGVASILATMLVID